MKIHFNGAESMSRKSVTRRWLDNYENKGRGWLMISSGSMAPLIQAGDLVFIEKIIPAKIAIGDIIAFWNDNKLVTHRVIRKRRTEGKVDFIERADRHPQHSLVSTESLMGIVRCIKRGGKIYHTDNLKWQILSRTIGTTFFFAYIGRHIIQNISIFPESMRKVIRKGLMTLRTKRENALGNYLNKKRKK